MADAKATIENPAIDSNTPDASLPPVATAISAKTPKQEVIIATVSDVSDKLKSEKDGKTREYFMVNFVDEDGQPITVPVGAKFFSRNEQRFVPDTVVSLTMENTIAGVTTWTDEFGNEKLHTQTGRSIRNVVKATKRQVNAIGREDTVNFAFAKVMPKLTAVEDVDVRNAMATLLQGIFK